LNLVLFIEYCSFFRLVDNEAISGKKQPTVSIVCTEFPRYFVAISRVRLVSLMVGYNGGSLKTDNVAFAARAEFPVGSVKKETKVALQVVILLEFFVFLGEGG